MLCYLNYYMYHDYCLRHKHHSYAACNPALAASDNLKAFEVLVRNAIEAMGKTSSLFYTTFLAKFGGTGE